MKQVILDTSFILTAVRQKIDFFSDFQNMALQVLIPEQVIREINSLSSTGKGNSKSNAALALRILDSHSFKTVSLPGKNTDNAIVNFAKENPETLVATLDKEIKYKIKNSKLIIRQKKKLQIERK